MALKHPEQLLVLDVAEASVEDIFGQESQMRG